MSTNLAYLSPRAWVQSPSAAAWALSVSIDDAGSSSCRSCLRAQKARPAAWLASEGEKNRYRKSSSVGTGLPATWKTLGSGLLSPLRGPVPTRDRKSVVEGKSVSVRVDLGGRRILKKKKK